VASLQDASTWRLWLIQNLGSDHLDGQAGTRGFLATEKFGPYPSIPLRTDVWQIGMVMWSLMRERPDGVDFTDKEGDWEMADYLLDEEGDYDALYSVGLDNLVARCLHRNPAQRIDLPLLLADVRNGRQAYNDQTEGGKYSRCAEDEIHAYNRVRFVQDNFAPGAGSTTKQRPSSNLDFITSSSDHGFIAFEASS
jgi:serine/threonine protein kinase